MYVKVKKKPNQNKKKLQPNKKSALHFALKCFKKMCNLLYKITIKKEGVEVHRKVDTPLRACI